MELIKQVDGDLRMDILSDDDVFVALMQDGQEEGVNTGQHHGMMRVMGDDISYYWVESLGKVIALRGVELRLFTSNGIFEGLLSLTPLPIADVKMVSLAEAHKLQPNLNVLFSQETDESDYWIQINNTVRYLALLDPDADIRDLMDGIMSNSMWEWVHPEEISALTSAPILSDNCFRDDHGAIEEIHYVWAYMDYALYDPAEQLRRYGHIIWQGYECESSQVPYLISIDGNDGAAYLTVGGSLPQFHPEWDGKSLKIVHRFNDKYFVAVIPVLFYSHETLQYHLFKQDRDENGTAVIALVATRKPYNESDRDYMMDFWFTRLANEEIDFKTAKM